MQRRHVLAGASAAVLAKSAQAQPVWRPDRPVRMVVLSGAGSGGDVVARALAAKLAELRGQPVVVDNQGGGAGAVGALMVSRARPDGLTLMCAISSILLAPLVDPSLAYDVRQFQPVSQIHQGATVLAVPARVPARTLAEFVTLARAKPNDFTIGTYGHGTASHIHAALLSRRAALGTDVVHYQNTPPAIRDMLAGHISCAFIDNASGLALLRDGQLRGLAVSGRRRLGVLPDIPSFGELGFPHFEPAIWQAVFLPLGTPAPIAASITAAVRAAIGSEEVSERLRGIGFEPVGGSAEALSSMIAAERETWSAVIAETGIRAAQ